MSDPVDVGVLSGMTPAIENALRVIGFHRTSDILRANRQAVAAAVPGLTVKMLRDWQVFAQILEIQDMTTAVSGAAVEAGIGSFDEFVSRSLTQLRAIAAAVPPPGGAWTDDVLAGWLKDAVRLQNCGVLNSTVVNAAGSPVEGVVVQCDGIEATTDAMGRSRHTRLRLGVPLTVVLTHAQYGSKTLRGVQSSPLQALQGTRFQFSTRKTNPRPLSALQGDKLPPIGTAPVRQDVQDTAPADNDVLRIVDRYANNDARCVSRFLDFVNGQFVARVYRIPIADLPAGAQAGDDLRKEAAVWVRTTVTAREIRREQKWIAAKKKLGSGAVTDVKLDKTARAILNALSDD